MLKIISHRGNINGSNPTLENNPLQIQLCIDIGFYVEIDVWYIDDKLYLGHDTPVIETETDIEWLRTRNSKLWIHCKNIEALSLLKDEFNVFGHDNDNYILTSKNYIWVYPNKQLTIGCVAVMPEKCMYTDSDLMQCDYICTDFPLKYKNKIH